LTSEAKMKRFLKFILKAFTFRVKETSPLATAKYGTERSVPDLEDQSLLAAYVYGEKTRLK